MDLWPALADGGVEIAVTTPCLADLVKVPAASLGWVSRSLSLVGNVARKAKDVSKVLRDSGSDLVHRDYKKLLSVKPDRSYPIHKQPSLPKEVPLSALDSGDKRSSSTTMAEWV